MGRPLRWQKPGTVVFVTNRTVDGRFLLRPDPECNALFGLWLARALRRHPGVRLLAVTTICNHFHLLAVDQNAELAAFAQYFQTNLAKAINTLRGREGHVFSRRYSAEHVLDKHAELRKLVYTACNPQRAGLCDKWEDWPGILLFSVSGKPEAHTYRWFHAQAYEQARQLAEKRGRGVREEDFWETEVLTVHPIEGLVDVTPDRVVDQVRAYEAVIRAERDKPVLGAATVVRQSPNDRPKKPKRATRPLCHTVSAELRLAFKKAYAEFCERFWIAAEQLRTGAKLSVRFPEWSFPPWRPLVRPVAGVT